MTAWLFAALHLLALGIGLGAVWGRFRALRTPLSTDTIRRALYADSWWGIAAVVWVSTGLMRAFGGLEKGTDYYLHNPIFHLKMGLLLLILLLELWPMLALVQWRIRLARSREIDTHHARAFARISLIQAHLIGLMVLAAAAMARGNGAA
jgi:putative membrane protein